MGRKPKEQEPAQDAGPSAKNRLSSFLKENKDDHYNYEEEV